MKRQNRRGLRQLLWEALTLDRQFYEDAHQIPHANRIARQIVLLAGLSHSLGSLLLLMIYRPSLPLIAFALFANWASVVGGYYFWTFTVWQIYRWLSPQGTLSSSYRELLSLIGFAHTPQLFNYLTVIPLLGQPIQIILATWSLLTVTASVHYGLQISLRRAILICVIGWPLVQIAIGVVQRSVQQLALGL